VQDHGYESLTVNFSSAGSLIVIDGGRSNDTSLVLTGSSNGFNYSTVLQTIRCVLLNALYMGYLFPLPPRYINTADDPDTTTRKIEFVINDGRYENSTIVIISVLADNDNPTMV